MIKKAGLLMIALCIMLTAASAMLYSCGDDEEPDENILGSGSTSFKLEIVDDKGESKSYTVRTSEKTVGDALIHDDVKIIPADQKDKMITVVDGITADFDADGSFWSFSINGEFAMIGAFDAEIEPGTEYKFEYVAEMLWD